MPLKIYSEKTIISLRSETLAHVKKRTEAVMLSLSRHLKSKYGMWIKKCSPVEI